MCSHISIGLSLTNLSNVLLRAIYSIFGILIIDLMDITFANLICIQYSKWTIKNTPFQGIFHTAKTCEMYFREFYLEWLKPTHMSSQFFKMLEVRFFIKSFDDVLYFWGLTIYLVLLILKDFSEEAFSESSKDATLISKCFGL